MTATKFNYRWKLSELPAPAPDAPKVFSCFACGGGSSMGYKLAGYNVIGGNEIDLRMARHYVRNLNPKYLFVEPIQEFKLRDDLPRELYHLDVLDGSPPALHSQWQAIEKKIGVGRSTSERDSKRKSWTPSSLTSSTWRRSSDQRW